MNMICSSRFQLSLFLLITTSFLSTHEADTINTTQTLTDSRNETIVSAGGVFALGFFSPASSNNRYVGIWYNKIEEKTTVWVANKDNPLTDRSGTLRVIQPGRLLLVNATNATIWSSNTSTSLQNPITRLLDSGNLVVTDQIQNSNNFIWQSFDYPTDTFLPGMKLGWNYKTGHEVYLTSATNQNNPTSGDFTYHCDPTGYPQLVIKDDSSATFKTGPWNGVGFSGDKYLEKNSIFTSEVVQGKDEVYYHFELLNDSLYARFTLSESGYVQTWIWSEKWILNYILTRDNCDVLGVCGAYGFCEIEKSPLCSCLDRFKSDDSGDLPSGCIPRTPLNCKSGDSFLKYSGVKLPDTEHSWYDESMTLEECNVTCSRNCSCTAYTSLHIIKGGCLLWFGDLIGIRAISPGQDVYIRVASSESVPGSRNRKMEIVIVTSSLVAGVIVLIFSLLLYSLKRKRLDHQRKETGKLRRNYLNTPSEETHQEIELPMLDLSTITEATDDFAINNKLGEGGFGPVYKARHEGQEVAVKCLSRTSLQGVDEFKNEVICIAKLQHRNLVKLLGCCIQGEEKMLVYEYMTNRSLDLILFDPMKSTLLEWPMRFNIINGIARGVMYLHQDSRLRVIHRDLKTSNILLDSDMNPKISDFGLARTFGGNETGANTNRIVGTYGYMSPEYAGNGLFSVKSDMFSFGVIVLEIVSGKRNKEFCYRDHYFSLLGYAWMLHKDEKSLELVDSCLKNSCNVSQVLRSIHVGLLCIQEHSDDRPNMSSVVTMLTNDDVVLPQPEQPGFFTQRDLLETKISGSATMSSSLLLEGR